MPDVKTWSERVEQATGAVDRTQRQRMVHRLRPALELIIVAQAEVAITLRRELEQSYDGAALLLDADDPRRFDKLSQIRIGEAFAQDPRAQGRYEANRDVLFHLLRLHGHAAELFAGVSAGAKTMDLLGVFPLPEDDVAQIDEMLAHAIERPPVPRAPRNIDIEALRRSMTEQQHQPDVQLPSSALRAAATISPEVAQYAQAAGAVIEQAQKDFLSSQRIEQRESTAIASLRKAGMEVEARLESTATEDLVTLVANIGTRLEVEAVANPEFDWSDAVLMTHALAVAEPSLHRSPPPFPNHEPGLI